MRQSIVFTHLIVRDSMSTCSRSKSQVQIKLFCPIINEKLGYALRIDRSCSSGGISPADVELTTVSGIGKSRASLGMWVGALAVALKARSTLAGHTVSVALGGTLAA